MIDVPAETPVTTPLILLASVATLVLLLLQVPPETPFVSVVFNPTQTDRGPPMIPGFGTTVTFMVSVCRQPPASVTVTWYAVVTVGVAITGSHVVQLSPPGGVQL
jgi:hypothetical protein